MRNYSIVVSFFLLWLSAFISEQQQFLLGLVFILSFGILHGSNDIFLIQKTENLSVTRSYLKIITLYILFIIINLLAFFYLPAVILLIFIIFSAYHFGEQHWTNSRISTFRAGLKLFYFIYGSFILFLLFYLNSEETSQIVYTITNINYDFALFSSTFNAFLILYLILFAFYFFKMKELRKVALLELLYLVVFTIVFAKTSLIWGFAIYFIIWHSIPSMFDQVTFIYDSINFKNLKHYLIKALPYWAISSVGIIILYVMFNSTDFFYALFFSFLAAVTFPHSLIINRMFSKKRTKNNI